MKKIATPLHQSMPVCIKQIMAGKPSSAVVCCFKVSFTVKWKKNCQIGQRQLYSRIVVWKIIERSKYQLIFVTAEEVLSKPFLSRLKQLPHLFNHRLYVCLFLSVTVLPVFLFNSFCLVTCYFPECSDAQLIRGCFAFQQPPWAGIFSPSPPSFPPPPLSSNRHGGLDKRSRAS